MARINIEDSLYKDGRFMALYVKLQSVETAIGAMVRVWTVAQEYFLLDDRKIPREVWDKQRLNDEVIRCGLAIEKDGRIEVDGAEQQFSWLLQRVEAGRRGGQSRGKQDHDLSDDVRIQRSGARSILAKAVSSGKIEKPDHCSECGATDCIIEGHHADYSKPLDVEWLCKRCHTDVHRSIRKATAKLPDHLASAPQADTKPSSLTLSLTPPLSLSSDSTSNSDSNNLSSNSKKPRKRKVASVPAEPKAPSKAQLFIARYCENFSLKYNASFSTNGKLAGLMKNMAERLKEDEINTFVDAYFSLPDPLVFKARHPVETMNYKFNEILIFAKSGKFTSMIEAKNLEQRQNIASLSQAIREGKNF